MDGAFAVELKNVTKVFGNKKIIDGVDLAIPEKAFVTFLGPSGCGKTTLLRMIAGFYEPDGGEILIRGRRVDRLPPYRRNTAMVFQEYALFPHLTVFRNVAYGLEVENLPKEQIRTRVSDALQMMQLSGLEGRFPNQLSGGQQQRVAVARALVMNPDALLLDEPLSNLDAKLRESVRLELRQIQQRLGLTAVYVTHDQQEALAMSDRIVVLDAGSVQQVGTAREIYFHPATRFVADFIGTTNLIDVETAPSGVRYRDVPLCVPGPDTFRATAASIRPEAARLENAPAENCFSLPVTIRTGQFLGEKLRCIARDRYGQDWVVDRFNPGASELSGDMFLVAPPEAIHLIKE